MATSRTVKRFPGTGQTVLATTADLATYTLAASTSAVIQFYVVGKNSSGDSVSIAGVAGAKRAGAGAALVGAVAGLLTVADAAVTGSTATLVASGNDIILRATGVALQTVDWFGEIVAWEN